MTDTRTTYAIHRHEDAPTQEKNARKNFGCEHAAQATRLECRSRRLSLNQEEMGDHSLTMIVPCLSHLQTSRSSEFDRRDSHGCSINWPLADMDWDWKRNLNFRELTLFSTAAGAQVRAEPTEFHRQRIA